MINSERSDLLDAIGMLHRPVASGEHPRIVCLVPSITELLCELGLAPFIVGRTGFCVHPKEVLASIPKIGGTKDVNIEKIRKLAPTHLVVNIDENEKPTVDQLAQFIPHIVVTHPNHPRDNLQLFRLLGAIFNRTEQAQELCFKLEQALERIANETRDSSTRVLYCIWKDPWMTVSQQTYIAAMLGLRGWQHWESQSNTKRYPSFEWNELMLQEIDVVLLSTEPYSFRQEHADQLQVQLQKPVLLVDGEMLSWYGSRAIAGIEYFLQLKL